MSIVTLTHFLPDHTLAHLKKWFGHHRIHIKVTKGRTSKLGDYRQLRDGSHEITINSTLEQDLFFFVLTHELAHLIAFDTHGRRILPHGKEWKSTFRDMLIESLSVYSEDLQPIIVKFSISPKANFMASPDLVKYFYSIDNDNVVYVENLSKGDNFVYKNDSYIMEGLVKKNYLCKNVSSGKKYLFKPLAQVEKCS